MGMMMIKSWMYWDSNGYGVRWTEGETVADIVSALPEESPDGTLSVVDDVPVVAMLAPADVVLGLPALLNRWTGRRAKRVREHTTATNWRVTYDPGTRRGFARHTSSLGSGATFTVLGAGTVVFRTEDKVPHDTITGVQAWVSSLG